MKPVVVLAMGLSVVLATHLPRCSRRGSPAATPHAGEPAWIGEDGDLVIAPGYVMNTAGECAALVDDSLPLIPFEDADKCFQKAPVLTNLLPMSTPGATRVSVRNAGAELYYYDAQCVCHPGTTMCPPIATFPCDPSSTTSDDGVRGAP